MKSASKHFSEAEIKESIEASGGLSSYRLIVAKEYKTIQHKFSDGSSWSHLVIEDDGLSAATIQYLENVGAEQISMQDWLSRER